MNRALRFLPLLILAAFVGAVAWRLSSPVDEEIASQQVGKPVPAVALPQAIPGKAGLDFTSPYGPRVINFFASWCVPCIAEAPVLAELKRQGVRIDGIAVRDRPGDVAEFLTRHGDPYETIGADHESKVQIMLGSAGVPETFIVDAYGTIRYQYIGPLEPKDIATVRKQWESLRR